MIKTETRHIDGHEFESVQFPARRAFKYQTKIFKLFAPLAAIIGKADSGSVLDNNIDFTKLNDFADRLDENRTVEFVLELLSTTRIDGKEITAEIFDIDFAGEILLVYKVLLFVLELNYKSFFANGGIGKILGNLNPLPPVKRENSAK